MWTSPGLRAPLLALLSLAAIVAAGSTAAAEEARARLRYAVAAGAEGCPTAGTFSDLVSAHVGYVPFDETSSMVVEVDIAPNEGALVGTLLLVAPGREPEARSYREGIGGCETLARSMALVLALRLDPIAAEGLPPPGPEGTSPEAAEPLRRPGMADIEALVARAVPGFRGCLASRRVRGAEPLPVALGFDPSGGPVRVLAVRAPEGSPGHGCAMEGLAGLQNPPFAGDRLVATCGLPPTGSARPTCTPGADLGGTPPSAPARPSSEPERTGAGPPLGPTLSLLFGLHVCIPNGESRCDGESLANDPGARGYLSFRWRFLPYLAAEAGFSIGFWTPRGEPPEGASTPAWWHYSILVGPRGFFPLGPVDLTAAILLGWGRHIESADVETTGGGTERAGIEVDGFVLGLGFGAEWRLVDFFALGLSAQFRFPTYTRGCVFAGAETECDDIDTREVKWFFDVTLGLVATFYITP
jgi:hypothetical protein